MFKNNSYDDYLEIYLPFLNIKLLSKHQRWKQVAKILKISKQGQLRLDWIIYYQTKAKRNASLTARRFGISRKTFYKYLNKFNEDNLYTLYQLEDQSRAPKHVRQPEIKVSQEQRAIKLRKEKIRYGKVKLSKLYQKKYGEKLSSWQFQKVIEKHGLYYNPSRTEKISRKRTNSKKKKRITELKLNRLKSFQKTAGYIICLDTIVIYRQGLKRYILTAIDKYAKIAYARMYKSKSTINSQDFLLRLSFLLDSRVKRVGHDNGTEFEKYFKQTCKKLKIKQYYSRTKTPKDNPDNERFNQTLRQEFIDLGNFNTNTEIFNKKLTNWLIEYNFYRPHQTLVYLTPIEYIKKNKVLPMSSSRTNTVF
jgi:transposase InsO family protein